VPRVVVFDTNILFSAIGWKGKPFECVELARSGAVDVVTCAELLDELSAKLQSKLSFTADQAADSVIDVMTFSRVVAIPGRLKAVAADPDDDKTLECAVIANATHVVTGDRRHLLPMCTFQGVYIVSAADCLKLCAER
jgi:putative PIN family toxin of toxin-antitoxin system